MATQRERLVELLADFGIEPAGVDHDHHVENAVTLAADDREHGPVIGYYGFYCQFGFDTDGNFTQLGIWE